MEVYKVLWFTIFEVILVHFVQFSWCTHDMEEWRLHEKRIQNFPCSVPQARSFKLEEIVEENEIPDLHSEVFPKMTVLHRCDSQSGCCKSSTKACAAQVTEDVTLTFRIFNRMNKRNVDGSKVKFLHVTTSNHTLCSCQSAHDLPK